MREIIIDSFAGGGGASTGIEAALGRPVDVAINHDAEAIRMHAANHPGTLHLNSNIYHVDPRDVRPGEPIGLLWASPDCTHHSKAKGGVPIRNEGLNSRDLAWVIVDWAQRRRPRVIIMENVEEWKHWGPVVLGEDGQWRACPDRKGEHYRDWVKAMKRAGYRLESRELRACDYGAPTIRKRLFLIARCDGAPIVWPAPSHGAPDDPGVIAGRKKPWRTAAEILDWSQPCPSIFMTAEEGRAYTAETGVRVKRPLAPNTLARVAKGVKRYVLDAAEPFIVSIAHGDSGGRREYPLAEPLGTVTSAGNPHAVVSPILTYAQQGGGMRNVQDPHHTITASAKDQNAVIAPVLAPRYGERPGQEPRSRDVSRPLPTVVGTGNGAGLVAPFLAQHNTGVVGHDAREPVSTITTRGTQQNVAAVSLQKYFGTDQDPRLDAPLCTMTTRDRAGLVAAHMVNMKGSQRSSRSCAEPVTTQTTQSSHAGVIAALAAAPPFAPEHEARARMVADFLRAHGAWDEREFVTVEIEGQTFVIVDIGLRMLAPREQFRAQGFPDTYRIDADADGRPFTKTVQVRCCGNSVCPDVAEALAAANVQLRDTAPPAAPQEGPLFAVAAE